MARVLSAHILDFPTSCPTKSKWYRDFQLAVFGEMPNRFANVEPFRIIRTDESIITADVTRILLARNLLFLNQADSSYSHPFTRAEP